MTTLYRTPNIIIDRHEWHAAVVKHYGKTTLRYFWRPLTVRVERWQPLTAWQSPKPKRMRDAFSRFRNHIREAMQSEQERDRALEGVQRTTQYGTPRRPAGRQDPHHHGLGLVA